MPPEVWLRWQALWNSDPWDGERGDLQTGIIAHSVYRAMYGAVNRVIMALSGEADEFDYEALPSIRDLMPRYGKRQPRGEDIRDEPDEDEPGDGRPLDPNAMTPAQWERHMLEVSRWQAYQAARMAALQLPAPGTVAESEIR